MGYDNDKIKQMAESLGMGGAAHSPAEAPAEHLAHEKPKRNEGTGRRPKAKKDGVDSSVDDLFASFKGQEKKTRTVTIATKPSDYAKWKKFADVNGLTMSVLINTIVNDYIDSHS